MINNIRNIAIIAHVDHGKTTLIDQLLKQSGTLAARTEISERAMDSNELEKERGITILAKNTAITWGDYRINVIDTPGHADFGGEVERVLSMVDSVLLLVDAVDGPMPQTRFVTQKAFDQGLNPIVVINKIDRPSARPDWVINQVFDLFDQLGASDNQLDFPVIYASALQGYAGLDSQQLDQDMKALFDIIITQVPPPNVTVDAPLQMQISALDYSSYVGAIGIGRISRGRIKTNMPVVVVDSHGKQRQCRVLQVLGHLGLERHEVQEALAGDIVAVTGIEKLQISDTICAPENPQALPALEVDEPTMSMTFQVNDSPLAGQEGKFITSRKIDERLQMELIRNVALGVQLGDTPNKFIVSGRGELHLSILIETMRREGYELAVSRPEVITKEVDGELCEPYELLTVDTEQQYQGAIMEKLGARQGQLTNMEIDDKGRSRLDYVIPARGLIGFHTEFLTITSGTGIMHHVFDHYDSFKHGIVNQRSNGVLIANMAGKSTAYSLWNLQARGRLLITPQTQVYEGMIVGLHSRDNDLVVNVTKEKQLTNVRASGTDESIILTPAIQLSLEQSLELIADDELVEVTPQSLRIRKKFLKEHERKRSK